MSLIVRDATLEDAGDILAIYNHAALNTTAVWTDGPVDLDSRRAWIRARREAGYPVLVAMKGRDVVGFASFGDFRPWPGYRHTVENSVYVDERHHRAGIGRSLMVALIERATALNKHTMVRRFLPHWEIRDGDVSMFRPTLVAIKRYRYRGSRIPTLWSSESPPASPALMA